MKKKLYFKLIIILTMFLAINLNSSKVFADTVKYNAEAKVSGEIKKGNNIEIDINTDKIDSIYAADIYFKYDKSLLKVTSLEKGNIFSDKSVKTFDVENKFDNSTGTVRLEFSCLGKVKGYSGSGSLIVIKAEVLKDGVLSINSKPYLKNLDDKYNLKLQIVNENVKELNFNFTPYSSSGKSGETIGNDNTVKTDEQVNNDSGSGTSNIVQKKSNNETGKKVGTGVSNTNDKNQSESSYKPSGFNWLIIIGTFVLISSGVIFLLLKIRKKKKINAGTDTRN